MKTYIPLSLLVSLLLLPSGLTVSMQPDTVACISSTAVDSQNPNSSHSVLFPALTRQAAQQLPTGLGKKSRQSRARLMQDIAQLCNPQETQPDAANIQTLILFLQSKKGTYSQINQQWIDGQIAMLKSELARTLAAATIEPLPSANSALVPTTTPSLHLSTASFDWQASQLPSEKDVATSDLKYLTVPEDQEIFAPLEKPVIADQALDGLDEFEPLAITASDTETPASQGTAQGAKPSGGGCCIQ